MTDKTISAPLKRLAFYLNLNAMMQPDSSSLPDLVKMRMPFGKYKNVIICPAKAGPFLILNGLSAKDFLRENLECFWRQCMR
jgi:uncharacterized protein (DUF3820 family)